MCSFAEVQRIVVVVVVVAVGVVVVVVVVVVGGVVVVVRVDVVVAEKGAYPAHSEKVSDTEKNAAKENLEDLGGIS